MEADPLVAFGKSIRGAREKKGFSQERLAELSDLHRTYVGAVERGERNVSLRNIVKLAKALEIKPYKLLEGIE